MGLFYYTTTTAAAAATTTTTVVVVVVVITTTTEKAAKIQEFMYRDATNVEHEMYDYTGNNWSHWNNNKRFKKKFGSYTIKVFNRFTTKDHYTGNITHNKESTAV